MEYQGQHGHATDKVEGYGQPLAGHGGATGGPTGTHGAAAGTGQLQPTRDDHKTDGVLRRSGSSSSSSSEDDGVGGRRKKGVKEKIKEKLPGGAHKDATGQQHTPAAGEYAGTGTHGAEATGEKKGVKEKIKEKLPGGAHKDATGQQHTPAAGEYAGTGTGTHGTEATGTHGAEATGEKKGVMDKIKEKLPGGQH